MIFDYLVIAGGMAPSVGYIKKLLKISKNIVTVDRGGKVALSLKLKPLLHIGDGDSFSQKDLEKLRPQTTISLDPAKNFSDLEFALRKLDSSKTKLVVGAHVDHEDRPDHSFLNLLTLAHTRCTIFADEKNWIVPVFAHSPICLSISKGTGFSIAPLRRGIVSINGSAYDLKGKVFKFQTEGLSNFSKSKAVRIETSSSALLFVSADITKTKIDGQVLPR